MTPPDPRVQLAAERTLLAWVRTGLALMGFGFVVAKFGLFLREMALARGAVPAGSGGSLPVGVGMVVLGVGVVAAAGVVHGRYLRRLAAGEPVLPPEPWFAIGVAGLIAAAGAGMAAYLLAAG